MSCNNLTAEVQTCSRKDTEVAHDFFAVTSKRRGCAFVGEEERCEEPLYLCAKFRSSRLERGCSEFVDMGVLERSRGETNSRDVDRSCSEEQGERNAVKHNRTTAGVTRQMGDSFLQALLYRRADLQFTGREATTVEWRAEDALQVPLLIHNAPRKVVCRAKGH